MIIGKLILVFFIIELISRLLMEFGVWGIIIFSSISIVVMKI